MQRPLSSFHLHVWVSLHLVSHHPISHAHNILALVAGQSVPRSSTTYSACSIPAYTALFMVKDSASLQRPRSLNLWCDHRHRALCPFLHSILNFCSPFSQTQGTDSGPSNLMRKAVAPMPNILYRLHLSNGAPCIRRYCSFHHSLPKGVWTKCILGSFTHSALVPPQKASLAQFPLPLLYNIQDPCTIGFQCSEQRYSRTILYSFIQPKH